MRKVLQALVVWIVVAVLLWLLARALSAVGEDLTSRIASFLDAVNIIVGFLAALWYYFFGPDNFTYRR